MLSVVLVSGDISQRWEEGTNHILTPLHLTQFCQQVDTTGKGGEEERGRREGEREGRRSGRKGGKGGRGREGERGRKEGDRGREGGKEKDKSKDVRNRKEQRWSQK